MRETHVRFCESKENRVAPYFLATRYCCLSDIEEIRRKNDEVLITLGKSKNSIYNGHMSFLEVVDENHQSVQ